jgi:hypothetical protein
MTTQGEGRNVVGADSHALPLTSLRRFHWTHREYEEFGGHGMFFPRRCYSQEFTPVFVGSLRIKIVKFLYLTSMRNLHI